MIQQLPGVDFKVLGNEFVPRDGQAYNYNPTNFFQRPDDRLNAGFFGKYEVSDNAEVYVDLTYMKSESNAQIAYSGTFGNITSFHVITRFLSEQIHQVVCGDYVGMGGDHAPDFATAAEALLIFLIFNLVLEPLVMVQLLTIDHLYILLKEMLRVIQDNQFLTIKALPNCWCKR